MSVAVLTLPEAARIVREATKDKSYRAFPLGQEAGRYLRAKRKRLTADSYRDYEACLDKLARHFTDLHIGDFEPPVGTERLEEFLDHQWGHREPRTYNKNHSILADFFRFQVLRGSLHGDPMLPVERAKPRGVHREVFSADQRLAIFAANGSQPDITALRLLLTYGLRKGTLQRVQFRHFDFSRQRLTVFAKGGKVQTIPIPDAAFWSELDIHMRQLEAAPTDHLLPRTRGNKANLTAIPSQPKGVHGMHDWWYRCLRNAGIAAKGQTAGERMHKARHTAGQRVLDATHGNLKAVQKLLGHADIGTTGNIYTDWDIDQLADTLREMEDA